MGICCQSFKVKVANECSLGLKSSTLPTSRTPKPSIDRELIRQLRNKITILSRSTITGKRFDSNQQPFSKRETATIGSLELDELKYLGVSCIKGLNRYPNQDNFCTILDRSFVLLGVFDGHGQFGHDISSYVSKVLLNKITEKSPAGMPEAFITAFQETNELLQTEFDKTYYELSGTTASVALIRDKKMFIGHVGDSRIVLGLFENNEFIGKALTEDHTPKVPRESDRINKFGGIVRIQTNKGIYRVCNKDKNGPGLSISRSIGDFDAQKLGVICEPDFKEIDITDNCLVLVLGSDGLWDKVSEQEAVNIAAKAAGDAKLAAERLTNVALSRWIHEDARADDITAIVLFLPSFA